MHAAASRQPTLQPSAANCDLAPPCLAHLLDAVVELHQRLLKVKHGGV